MFPTSGGHVPTSGLARASNLLIFFRNTIFLIHESTYPYEYMHTHLIFMSISERLSRLDLEIHEVGH
jgi:hypothetical protein